MIATFPGSGLTGGVVDRLSLQSVLHTGTSLIPFGTMCVGFRQALCYVHMYMGMCMRLRVYDHDETLCIYTCAHTHAHTHVPEEVGHAHNVT